MFLVLMGMRCVIDFSLNQARNFLVLTVSGTYSIVANCYLGKGLKFPSASVSFLSFPLVSPMNFLEIEDLGYLLMDLTYCTIGCFVWVFFYKRAGHRLYGVPVVIFWLLLRFYLPSLLILAHESELTFFHVIPWTCLPIPYVL